MPQALWRASDMSGVFDSSRFLLKRRGSARASETRRNDTSTWPRSRGGSRLRAAKIRRSHLTGRKAKLPAGGALQPIDTPASFKHPVSSRLPFSESPIFETAPSGGHPDLHRQDDVVAFEPELEEVVNVERIDNGGRLRARLVDRAPLSGARSAECSWLTCRRARSRPVPAVHAS